GPTSPSVFPLTSCVGEATTSQVTFGCLVKDYTPESVTVQWCPSVSTSGLRTYPSMLQTSSGLYSLSSQVTVPASSWESNTYRCTVGHQPTSFSLSRPKPLKPATLLPESFKPQPPMVQVYHSCTTKPSTIHLLCLISGFNPPPVTVEWLVDGVSGKLQGSTAPAKMDAGGQTFSTHSNVSISQKDWMEDKTYTCRVSHQRTKTTVEDNAHKCKDVTQCSRRILVFMVPPEPSELYAGGSPMLICLVVNLPNSTNLTVVWSQEKSGPVSSEPLTFSEQSNRTFTASSILPISESDWEKGENYTCKVEHSELPSPIIKSISKQQGKNSSPCVYLLHPHTEELSNNGDSVSLTCMVRGFYPEHISVKWMENKISSDSDKSVTTSPMKEGDGDSTYFLYSKMTINKASWNNGTIYTCMVIHEALKPNK
uniref:Ig-like domain-containing protein n=1 Tax=Pelodiscus sinensis TaxID=13735 RepID=K7GDP2_PELSI